MSLFNKGKSVRLDESLVPLLERLRALMLNTASGLKINRADAPSDGMVVGFAPTTQTVHCWRRNRREESRHRGAGTL